MGIIGALGHVLVGKAGQITHNGIQLGRIVLAGRCQHFEHCRFFQPVGIKGNGHRLCADLRHVLGGIDRCTGAVHHLVRIERVDVDICHPPAGFRLIFTSAPVQPFRLCGVHLVVVFLGVQVEQSAPAVAAVGGIVQIVAVVRPPAQRGNHHRIRIPDIYGNAAEAALSAVVQIRRNIREAVRLGIVHIDCPSRGGQIRTAIVRVRQIQLSAAGKCGMQRVHACCIGSQCRPAVAAVCAFINAGAVCHCHADVHVAGSRIKSHPQNADTVALLFIVALFRKRGDLFPVLAVVGGFPQTAVTAAEPDFLVVIGVDAHAFAAAPSGLVAAAAERSIKACPRFAVIVRGKQCRIIAHIRAAGKINAVRLHRIGRHTLDPDIAPFVRPQKVRQRFPVSILFPAVQSADVCAGIDQPFFLGVILHAGDISAAANGNIAPCVVCLGSFGAVRGTAGADAAEDNSAQQNGCEPSLFVHVCVLRIPCRGYCKNFLLLMIPENGRLVNRTRKIFTQILSRKSIIEIIPAVPAAAFPRGCRYAFPATPCDTTVRIYSRTGGIRPPRDTPVFHGNKCCPV